MRWSRAIALVAASILLPPQNAQTRRMLGAPVLPPQNAQTRRMLGAPVLTAQGPSNVFVSQSQSGAEPTPTPSPIPGPGSPTRGGFSRDGVEAPTPASTQTPQPQQPSASATRNTPTFFVMIDPAHGGDDHGAVFGANLAEKDITLALARRLKSELQERGISARLLRDADVSLSLEQRAESANEQHAAAYIALHAGMPGQGVRVYAPALASVVAPVAGRFLIWEGAQANSLPRSQELAQRITVELDKKNVSATQLATPLRPLNNVSAPAVAVELTPDLENLQNLMAQKFQTAVAAGIAAGIAQLRPQLERER